MTEHVRLESGPSFANPARAARSAVGGVAGSQSDHYLQKLDRTLGPNALLLPRHSLVVDADACSLDGQPLVNDADWWRVVRSQALSRVEGAFVLAWSDDDGSLSMARDAIGHRSLYYAVTGDTLVFSSSIRAVLASGVVPRHIELRSVARYLACSYVPGRETLAVGVYELLPGELATFRTGVLSRQAYWQLPAEPPTFGSEAELQGQLRKTLERAIASHLPESGAVAASLSGGVDSSLVVALAQRLCDRPLATYSITFGPGYRDELEWSSLVASHCGTDHTIVELTPQTVLTHLDDTISCLDKPNGDPLTVPNALLFRTMAMRSSVALNGEGGDPCFGGPKNLPMLLSVLYGHDDGRTNAESALGRAYLRAHLKAFDELPELLSPEAYAVACSPPLEDELLPWFSDPRWSGLVSKLMAINTRFKGGHHILPKLSALSGPFGIRPRSPLFAKSVVELAFAIPPELKLRGADEKYLLKTAVADVLPPAIIDRKKSGMMVPVEGWFQGPLLAEARTRLMDGLAHIELFRRAYLEKLVGGNLGGLRPRRGVKLWLLITLEAHLRALGLREA